MTSEDLHRETKRVLDEVDATIKRSGMSQGRRKLALKLLKAKEDLRRLQMVNNKPKRRSKPR